MSGFLIALCAAGLGVNTALGDELNRASSWDVASPESIMAAVNDWTASLELPEESATRIERLWTPLPTSPETVYAAVIDGAAVALPEAAPVIAKARRGELRSVGELEVLGRNTLPPIIQDNLRLLFGKSLALSQLYDEAQSQLASAQPENVADPAALFFYRAVIHYRLRQKQEGLAALEKLLEREEELPTRYVNLAKLMQLDLESLKVDSLDEIARIMDSIHVRLGHGHAGTRVREEEQDVIDKLEKMIEDLEQQLQQMQMMCGQANGLQSNSPAQDSSLPGGQGQGDVGRKDLGEKTEWGNLPPKEREKTMQQLGKEFPSHYRDVIEEYFRKLARDEADENRNPR